MEGSWLARNKALILAIIAFSSVAYAGNLPFAPQGDIYYQYARSIDSGDANADGHIDLLGCRSDAPTNIVCWLSVDGSGTNWQMLTVWTGSTAEARFADVNGDGALDVIAVNSDDDQVLWHENLGAGTNWQKRLVDGAFAQPSDIRSADIDRDGRQDIVASGSLSDKIAWWRNLDSAGTNWAPYIVATNFEVVISVRVADMDRDGDPDIVGAARNADTISWFENAGGSGTNWIRHDVTTNFHYVQCADVADLDNDGDPDIVGSAQDPDIIRYWRNMDGSATNWQQAYVDWSATDPSHIFLTDFDRDGDVDVLSGERTPENKLKWYENRWSEGLSSFLSHTVASSYTDPIMVQADDINRDGNLDYLAAGNMGDRLSWYLNITATKSAVFPVKHTLSTEFDVYWCAAGDVDGDGDIDIASCNDVIYPHVNWWENLDAVGGEWTRHMIENNYIGPNAVSIADVNQDGRNDFLGFSHFSDRITWWSNADRSGTNLTVFDVTVDYDGPHSSVAVDMDRDGDMDVLSSGVGTNRITWWENTARAGTNWIQHDVAAMRTVRDADAADINGDGYIDVVGISYVYKTNLVWWRNMDGSATSWSQVDIETNFVDGWSVRGADMDLDGDVDVAAISYGGGTIAWWENTDGAGVGWTRRNIDTNFYGVRSFVLLDADADGDPDVAALGTLTNEIAWWENTDGTATAWDKHVIATQYTSATSIAVADINLDGMPDLVTAAMDGKDLSWWENRAGQYTLRTEPLAPTEMEVSSSSAVFRITLGNVARGPNTNYHEWVTLVLRGEGPDGVPLLETQFEDLFNTFSFYIDNGDGSFDPATDTNLHTWSSFNMSDDGNTTFAMPFGQPALWVAPGTSKTYFMEALLSSNAHAAWPNTFILTHLTGPNGTVMQDYKYDTPLQCYDWTHIASGTGTMAYAEGDVSIAKTASTNIWCGGEITYAVHITNRAQPIAVSLVMTDALPAGVTGITSSPPLSLPGLVLYLHLDETPMTSAVTVADSSGNGHDGEVYYPWSADLSCAGRFGGAISNRSESYIDLGNPPAMNFSGEITMAAWIKPSHTNGGRVVSHGYNRADTPEVYLAYYLNRYYAGTWSNGVSYAFVTAPEDIVDQWTHLAGIYDGSNWRIYHNGRLIKSTAGDLGAISLDEPWSVGAARNTTHTNSYFPGAIDEVMIFNRALTGREVYDLYRLTHPLGSFAGAEVLTGFAGGLPAGQGAILTYKARIGTNLIGVVTNRIVVGCDGTHYRDTNLLNQAAEAAASIPSDYDQDNMFDPWEWQHWFSPTNPADAAIDTDGDRQCNRDEYIADTDPREITSFFQVMDITHTLPMAVQFDSSASRLYILQGVTNLTDGSWSDIPGAGPRMGIGGTDSLSDTNLPRRGTFYRVGVQTP